jgi:ATP-independent RNA helicase DbpA
MNASGTVYFLLNIEDHLPKFLTIRPEEEELPTELVLPAPCEWKTLYIAAGKKDKINKMDIVGLLLKKGNLNKDEVGLIEVLDYSAYVAIKANKIRSALQNIKDEKIKNRKIKMEVSS